MEDPTDPGLNQTPKLVGTSFATPEMLANLRANSNNEKTNTAVHSLFHTQSSNALRSVLCFESEAEVVERPIDLFFTQSIRLLPILLVDSFSRPHLVAAQARQGSKGYDLVVMRSGRKSQEHFIRTEVLPLAQPDGRATLETFLLHSTYKIIEDVADVPSGFLVLLYQAFFEFSRLDLKNVVVSAEQLSSIFGQCVDVRVLMFGKHANNDHVLELMRVDCDGGDNGPLPQPGGKRAKAKKNAGFVSAATKISRDAAPMSAKMTAPLPADTIRSLMTGFCTQGNLESVRSFLDTFLVMSTKKIAENVEENGESDESEESDEEESEEDESEEEESEEESEEDDSDAASVVEHSGSDIDCELASDDADRMTKALMGKKRGVIMNGNETDDSQDDHSYENEYDDSDSSSNASEISAFKPSKRRRLSKAIDETDRFRSAEVRGLLAEQSIDAAGTIKANLELRLLAENQMADSTFTAESFTLLKAAAGAWSGESMPNVDRKNRSSAATSLLEINLQQGVLEKKTSELALLQQEMAQKFQELQDENGKMTALISMAASKCTVDSVDSSLNHCIE